MDTQGDKIVGLFTLVLSIRHLAFFINVRVILLCTMKVEEPPMSTQVSHINMIMIKQDYVYYKIQRQTFI